MTSQIAKPLTSKSGKGRTNLPQSEMPMGPQPTSLWPLGMLSVIYHGLIGMTFCPVLKAKTNLGLRKHPRPEKEKLEKRKERRKREANIPSLECKSSEPYCGFQGQIGYFHPAKTTYQQQARQNSTSDIQQYTKTVLPKKAERYILFLNFGSLFDTGILHSWQLCQYSTCSQRRLSLYVSLLLFWWKLPYDLLRFISWSTRVADNWSFVCRCEEGLSVWWVQIFTPGFCSLLQETGWYGRLDKNGVFPTTVTNVDPTAKQSRVLNPYVRHLFQKAHPV